MRQEDNNLLNLSQWEVVEMDLLNIWESRLSPRPQLLALSGPHPQVPVLGTPPPFLPSTAHEERHQVRQHDTGPRDAPAPGEWSPARQPPPPTPSPQAPGPAHSRRSTWALQISEATQMWPLMFYEVQPHCSPLFCV